MKGSYNGTRRGRDRVSLAAIDKLASINNCRRFADAAGTDLVVARFSAYAGYDGQGGGGRRAILINAVKFLFGESLRQFSRICDRC